MSDLTTETWRASRRKRLEVGAIATVGPPLIRILSATWRWRVRGREHLDAVERSKRPPIMAFWHGRILPATIFFRDRGIVVMTSENYDGEWIARIITRFGYGTARGSTSRGGVRALVQMKRDVVAGRPAAFTVDGPRGPAFRVQAGCIWLAKATGSPIVPFHIEASRFWSTRSWDRTLVPRPFSTIHVTIGPPFEVAPDADDAALEARRTALEEVLLRLTDETVAVAKERSDRRGP